MWFQGALTFNQATGTYTGTVAMIRESIANYGDGIDGFDVYAKNDVSATYDKAGAGAQDYETGLIVDHDAYTTAGGWGSFYNPDCADWDH